MYRLRETLTLAEIDALLDQICSTIACIGCYLGAAIDDFVTCRLDFYASSFCTGLFGAAVASLMHVVGRSSLSLPLSGQPPADMSALFTRTGERANSVLYETNIIHEVQRLS
ncbi:hypothetical protein GN958_ATG13138 [Phytophthora infestans]|uniref:Uncharacterized protein n=1 Tax=Phytophthora infestans TaxID=4787 RepID=A0A8S9U9X8_PHYIN|nr:hypothetical protein GN958_ATG13138 [Phytophthora infestans]